MPVMMPCAMRVGSMRTRSDPPLNHMSWYTVMSMSRLDAMHTSVCVRNPAGLPL